MDESCKKCTHYSKEGCVFITIENGPPYGEDCIGYLEEREEDEETRA